MRDRLRVVVGGLHRDVGAESGGTGGAVSTMGPNGVGARNSQLGAGLTERFYTETTSVTPSQTVDYPLPVGTFTGKVEVVARLTAAGGGGGTAGDYFTETFAVQGSNVGGAVTDLLMGTNHEFLVYDSLLYEDSYRKDVPFVFGDIRDHSALLPHLQWAGMPAQREALGSGSPEPQSLDRVQPTPSPPER